MFGKGPKYVVGDKWYAGSKCNGYEEKTTILEILEVIGYGKDKKLRVMDRDGNQSIISYKTLWKQCK